MLSALSDFKPCRTRQWQQRQFNSSQKSQDPKFSIPDLEKSKLQWQVPQGWMTGSFHSYNGRWQWTSYWEQEGHHILTGTARAHRGHRSALGHEAGLPLAVGSFGGSHVHILRHFLAHMVNGTKWSRLCCWQRTNRRWLTITCLVFSTPAIRH